jgi:hypothetical protein
MGLARPFALVCLMALGASGCSTRGAATEAGADARMTTISDAGVDPELCDAACAVVRGAGCPDPPEQGNCVADCLDSPLPCGAEDRSYGECLVASGSSAFMCVSDGAVLKDGYCETEGALLDKCVADNFPSSQNAPGSTARKLFARRVRHAPDEGN